MNILGFTTNLIILKNFEGYSLGNEKDFRVKKSKLNFLPYIKTNAQLRAFFKIENYDRNKK